MQTITTNLRYTRAQLPMLLNWARVQAVNRGGRYEIDVGIDDATVTVWTTSRITDEEKVVSKIMGTFFVVLAEENRIYEIEIVKDYTAVDIFHKLAILEREALGRIIHGKWQ